MKIGKDRAAETVSASPEKRKKRGVLPAVIALLALLVGLSLVLYPTVAEYISSLNFKREIDAFRGEVGAMGAAEKSDLLDSAESWNSELLSRGTRVSSLSADDRARYNSLLDPSGTGMMGFVEIAKLKIYLPIYHGTDESALHSGVGHLEGSSLPTGGKGTHCVLSGHTGLPSAKLFSNIDRLRKGDVFVLHILGETLTYRVESSVVLTPEQAERQDIDPEADICTLMTCTPYGVNTHRLLVRGVRIPNPAPGTPGYSDDGEIEIPMPVGLRVALILFPAALVAAVLVVVIRNRKPRSAKGGDPGGT